MDRNISGGWKAYVNPVLVLKPLECKGTTGEGEPCSFNGRYLCYNTDAVMRIYKSAGGFPTVLAYCEDHLPEKYENAEVDDALTVVDTKTVGCEASKDVDNPDHVSPMELQEAGFNVEINQKEERSAMYDCENTAAIRLFDEQGGHKDVCGLHARDSWLSAIEDPEEQADNSGSEADA